MREFAVIFMMKSLTAACLRVAINHDLIEQTHIEQEVIRDLIYRHASQLAQIRYLSAYKEWYTDGTLRRHAHFHNNERHGRFIKYHPNGTIKSITEYQEGKKHGEQTIWTDTGRIRKRDNFINGLPHGMTWIWCDSCVDIPHIEQTIEYKNGKFHGEWIEYAKNGTVVSKYNYRDGSIDGLYYKCYRTGGLNEQGWFRNGKHMGVGSKYDISGTRTFWQSYTDIYRPRDIPLDI
jgi:antitoxin component YwqK of YwqJK toxin-antitoxin module